MWYLPNDASPCEKNAIYAAVTTTEHCMLWVPFTSRRLSLMQALLASLKDSSVAVVAPKVALPWWKKTVYSKDTPVIACTAHCPEDIEVAVLDCDDNAICSNVPKTKRCIGILSCPDVRENLTWRRLRCTTDRPIPCELTCVQNTIGAADRALFHAAQAAARELNIHVPFWRPEAWEKDIQSLALKKNIRDIVGTKEVLLRLARMRTLLRDGKTDKVQEYINALPHGDAENWYHAQPFLDFIQALTAAHELGDPHIGAICDAVDHNVQSLIVTNDVDNVYTELQVREVAVEKLVKATQASAIWQRWQRNHLRVVVASSMDVLLPLISHGLRSCDVLIMAVIVPLDHFAHRVEIGKTIWVVRREHAELPPVFSTQYARMVSMWVEDAAEKELEPPMWPIETKAVAGKKRSSSVKARKSEQNDAGQKQLKLEDFGIRGKSTTRSKSPSTQRSDTVVNLKSESPRKQSADSIVIPTTNSEDVRRQSADTMVIKINDDETSGSMTRIIDVDDEIIKINDDGTSNSKTRIIEIDDE